MLDITSRDKWTAERIRDSTGVTDIIEMTKRSKCKWAGHVTQGGDKWIAVVLH